MQRELTASEIDDLLARQFGLYAKVLAHQKIVHDGNWHQGAQVEWNLPIPTRGVAVLDDAYGQVVVFPDASGVLHYNAFVADASTAPGVQPASEIGKPQFDSPTGNTLDQILSDLKRTAAGVALLAVLSFIGFRLLEKHGYV